MALGDAEKTKAIYIGIRAERLEDEAKEAARREAELETARLQREKERAQQEAASRKKSFPQKVNLPPPLPKVEPPATPKPEASGFSDPEIAKAVQAMREALAATGYKNG